MAENVERKVQLVDRLALFIRDHRSVCDFSEGIRADLRTEWRQLMAEIKLLGDADAALAAREGNE